MPASENFTLYVYDGDYGLLSMNVDCIKSVLYTTVARVPTEIKLLNNVKACLFHNAPCFIHKNLSFNSFADIVLYLNTLNYNLDRDLSTQQKSESLALTSLVQSKLRPVVEYVFWIDQRNFDELTRMWFAKALPLPFNVIHTNRFKENASDLIESVYSHDCSNELIKSCITSAATECLSSLSTRLGTLNYFYGDNPSTLDVIVYSYIAPLIKVPFPSNETSNLVGLWPNLASFVKRIDTKYLPEMPKQSKYLRSDDRTRTGEDDVSYLAISLITVSAISLVFGFAVSRGFITPRFL